MRSKKFIYIGFLLSLSAIFSSGLAYGYQILVSNYLSPKEYAEISFLVAFSVIFAAPFGGLLLKFTRDVSVRLTDKKYKLEAEYFQLIKLTFFYAPIIFILSFIIFIVPEENTLSKSFHQALFIVNLTTLLIFLQINSGVFIGRKDFISQGAYQLKLNILKILFFFFLIYIGKITTALCLLALIFSYLVIFVDGYKNLFPFTIKRNIQIVKFESPLKYKNIVSITLANIVIIGLMQLDIVFVNLFFSKDISGNYAVASLLGKSIFFLPVSLSDSHFSYFSENKLGDTKPDLYRSLIYTFFTSICCCLFFFLFSHQIINLFFGNKYIYAAGILKFYSLLILPIGFVFILENYFIAQKQYFYVWILFVLIFLACIFILFFHEEIYFIPLAFGASSFVFSFISIFNLLKK
jgi:O-antigen/teichoic acid export membrane protein